MELLLEETARARLAEQDAGSAFVSGMRLVAIDGCAWAWRTRPKMSPRFPATGVATVPAIR